MEWSMVTVSTSPLHAVDIGLEHPLAQFSKNTYGVLSIRQDAWKALFATVKSTVM
jgi:hypothetical protein